MMHNNREKCPKCKGDGGFEYPEEILPEHQWSECDECDGTGKVTIDSSADTNGWISVDDRVPERAVPVLGYSMSYTGKDKVRKVFRTSRGFYDAFECGCGCKQKITHWQPLPKPPTTN